MRVYDKSSAKAIDLESINKGALGAYMREERLRANSSRDAIERGWMDYLRMYAGVPPTNQRDIPIEQAPNVEITLGAIAVDGIFSNWIELVTQSSQLISVLPRKNYEQYADAVQDWIDWGCREAFNVEEAINLGPFDCIQLGSMALYIPYVEKIKYTDTVKVIDRAPKITPIAIEDFWLPEGSRGNIQNDRWVGFDMWLSWSDLKMYEKRAKWDLTNVVAAAAVSQVRQKRLDTAREQSSEVSKNQIYQIFYGCVEYDIDDDGFAEELEVVWDVTSGNVLRLGFPRYDIRPFEMCVYGIRPYVAWGLGVMEMCAPYEDEVSIIHNERTLNMRLANARIWKAKQTIKAWLNRLWPGKVIGVSSMDDFEGEKMADIYPSSAQGEMMTVAFAERRTGVSDMNAQSSRIGTRTPAMAAMSYQQAANRRFTPPYRNMRNCIAAGVRQCMYRVQEQIKAGDKKAKEDVMEVLGEDKGKLFVELCEKVDNLIDAVDLQLTAVSVSINREADRQSLTMLMQVWKDWQQQRVQLKQFEASAPTPELKELAEAIEKGAINLLRKFMRTFEVLGDVDKYLAEVKGFEELTGQLPPELQRGLLGISGQLQQGAQDMAQGGGAPAPANGAAPEAPAAAPPDAGAPQ